MAAKSNNNYSTFPANVLLIVGLVDLLRGFLHTFAVHWANATFAHLNLASGGDQLYLLGVFGISNILTGALYILISQKAKNLSPYVLGIIPLAYGVGLLGLKYSGVNPQSDFLGKYFMIGYLSVCALTSMWFFLKKFSKS